MVFLGTVTEELPARNSRVTRVRVRIDRAYKGVSEKTLILFDDGMCDGPSLELGEQYLIYTRDFGGGEAPSRGCTRSRHVKYAEEDLKYLSGLSEVTPTGTIFGRVVVRSSDDYHPNDESVSGALVELSGPLRTYVTTTDWEGRYSFENLDPAKYTVTADQRGFRMIWFDYNGEPPSATVEARGCCCQYGPTQKLARCY